MATTEKVAKKEEAAQLKQTKHQELMQSIANRLGMSVDEVSQLYQCGVDGGKVYYSHLNLASRFAVQVQHCICQWWNWELNGYNGAWVTLFKQGIEWKAASLSQVVLRYLEFETALCPYDNIAAKLTNVSTINAVIKLLSIDHKLPTAKLIQSDSTNDVYAFESSSGFKFLVKERR